MTAHTISRKTIVAVLVATIAALVARSWLQIRLIAYGMQQTVAADLSYLVVPVILVLLLFPLWQNEKRFVKSQFKRKDLTWNLVVTAITIGVLIRLLWWSQLIAGLSFGFYLSTDPGGITGPVFTFNCPSPENVLLGFVVMAILVPLIEEIIHRGFIQSALSSRGFLVAIIFSSIVFTIFHRINTWPTVFLIGLVLGAQYRISGSLWASVITHATINGLIQLDWRCLSGQWNPEANELPLLVPGIVATVMFIACSIALLALLRQMITGATNAPR